MTSTPPLSRSDFSVTEYYAYLNHAAAGVLPHATVRAIETFVHSQADAGIVGVFPYDLRMPSYRQRVAEFIGADASEIAFLRNTGDGANAIGAGLDWQPGDEIVFSNNEFPANALPWLALRDRGVNVRLFDTAVHGPLTPDRLQSVLTPRTRLVSVSWVGFEDGYRHDLAALAEVAHAGGALLVVDAIQGLGAFPLDVRENGVDAVYAGGQKWLMALQGIGFLYLRRSLLDRLKVAAPGWRSQVDMWGFLNYDQPLLADASRFEGGTLNFVGALSLATSIDVLCTAPRQAIAAHVIALTDRLCEGLQRLGASCNAVRSEGHASGIVTFAFPGVDMIALGRDIQHQEKIVTTWRGNGIRVSPHGYNTEDEIDALLAAVGDRVGQVTH